MLHTVNNTYSAAITKSKQASLAEGQKEPVVYCLAMVRNEADIIQNFLQHAAALFDKILLVDIQSTDGTKEIIDTFASDSVGLITRFTCRTQERYQGALMNVLARRAFSEGADWVFPLDADEFLDVENRQAFLSALKTTDNDVLHLPWINLAPNEFGDFETFRADQTFSCPAQPSPVCKVAISARYALVNPDFCFEEGNHNVSRTTTGRPESVHPSLPLLHLPIRSAQRLKYRMVAAARLLDSKHNTGSDEGHHVETILRRLEAEGATPDVMRSLALSYSLKSDKPLDSAEKSAPKAYSAESPVIVMRRLPAYARVVPASLGQSRSLKETLELDARTQWETARFCRGAPVGAEIKGPEIQIRCLPIDGRGYAFYGRYEALGGNTPSDPARLDVKMLTQSIAALFGNLPSNARSDPTAFHPELFALFSLLRPRRYVGLGVYNGASFFAACQASKNLKLETRCIAIDAWIDEKDAARAQPTFERFRSQLQDRFPAEHYIRGSFAHALQCFDDGSIDLLQIDGYHTHGGSVEDFASWLPKMSHKGTVILQDVNVCRPKFGLWWLWEELKQKYRAFLFHHANGLGIIYVGEKDRIVGQAIEALNSNPEYAALTQLFFAGLAERGSQWGHHEREEVEPFRSDQHDENVLKFDALLKSHRISNTLKRGLRRSLFEARALYWLTYLSSEKRKRYKGRKREIKEAIAHLDWKMGVRRPEKRKRRTEKVEIPEQHEFVRFNSSLPKPCSGEGLHPNIRLIIPTRGCSKWLPYFLDAYRAWSLEPTFAVDEGCEAETLNCLKGFKASMIFIDKEELLNGEAIMPYLSRHIEEDYILRLDDDEFPTKELIAWTSSIPDSNFAFVTSWWVPRYEVALIDGKVRSCHPAWMRTIVGSSLHHNLHGGRFFRHKEVTYGKIGAHHANFISDYVSHAPAGALMVHLDYILRTVEERLEKIRVAESRWKDSGWPLANYMMPEIAPRELLHLRDFTDPDLVPLIDELVEKIYRPTKTLTLGLDEIIAIQRDRLADNTMHFHY